MHANDRANTAQPATDFFTIKSAILSNWDGGKDFILSCFQQEGYQFRQYGKGFQSRAWNGEQSTRISVRPGKESWIWTDFGTGEGGDAFTLAAQLHNLDLRRDWGAVLAMLADFYKVDVTGLEPVKSFPKAPIKKEEKPQFPYLHNLDRNRELSVSYRYEIAQEAVSFYPKPISLQTLHRYGVSRLNWIESAKTGYRTYGTDSDPLYLFQAELNTKIYRPAQFRDFEGNPAGKQRPATYSGNYVFGLDQIPRSCEYILITAGQNDTLAVNDIANAAGVFAVCLWSESSANYLAPELLSELRSRCKAVFVGYDDDETGNRTAQELKAQAGIEVLRIPHSFAVNDICDAIEKAGKEAVANKIIEEIARATRSKDSRRWVSEYEEEILEHISKNRRAVIACRTGAGKTHAFLSEGGIAKKLHEKTGKKIAFAVPNRAMAKQASANYNIPFLIGGMTTEERKQAAESTIRVVTYDSFPNLLRLSGSEPNDEIAIIDEYDELVNTVGFRGKAVTKLFDYMQEAFSVVCLSATPNHHFEKAGYNTLTLNIATEQKVNILPYFIEGDPVETLIKKIRDWDLEKGVNLVYINDIKAGKLIKDIISPLLPEGRRIALINSEEPGKDYEHLAKCGLLHDDLALVIVTKLIEAGINIENTTIGNFCAVVDAGEKTNSYPNPRDLAQVLGRCRKMKDLEVSVFLRYRKGKAEMDKETIFSNLLSVAAGQASAAQACENLQEAFPEEQQFAAARQKFDEKRIRENFFSKEIEPDFLRVSWESQRLYLSSLPSWKYLEEVGELVPYASVQQPATIAPDHVEGYQEKKTERREATKAADAKLLAMVLEEPEPVLEAAYHSTQKVGLKIAIRQHAGHIGMIPITPKAFEIKTEQKETFSHTSFDPIGFFFELEKLGFDHAEIEKIVKSLSAIYTGKALERMERSRAKSYEKEIIEMKAAIEREDLILPADSFRYFTSQIETMKLVELSKRKETSELLSRSELWKAQAYRNFKTRIGKNIGEAMTAASIENAYRKAFSMEAHPGNLREAALHRFKELFEYKVVRAGKKTRYQILGKISAEKTAEKFGFSWEDFLKKNRQYTAQDKVLSNKAPDIKTKAKTLYKSISNGSLLECEQLTIPGISLKKYSED